MKKMLLLLFVPAFSNGSQPAPTPLEVGQLNKLEQAVSSGVMQQVLDQLNDAKNNYDSSLLSRAMNYVYYVQSQAQIAELLIMRGADVNADIGYDTTPLLSASHRSLDVSRLLLYNKANPNHANIDGTTALHSAINFSQPDTVQLLLEHQASLHIPDKHGITPLYAEFYFGSKEDQKKVREILAPYKEQARKEKIGNNQ